MFKAPQTQMTATVTSRPTHANIRKYAIHRIMEPYGAYLSSLLFLPALGDVIADTDLLLRPWIQRAGPARRRLARSRVEHHHIAGAARQTARREYQDQKAQSDLLRASTAGVMGGRRSLLALGRARGRGGGVPVRTIPPPTAQGLEQPNRVRQTCRLRLHAPASLRPLLM